MAGTIHASGRWPGCVVVVSRPPPSACLPSARVSKAHQWIDMGDLSVRCVMTDATAARGMAVLDPIRGHRKLSRRPV